MKRVGILGRGLVAKTYEELLRGHKSFVVTEEPWEILFSTSSNEALEWEYAKKGMMVIASGSHHRKNPLVPMIIPEINQDHLSLLGRQREHYGLPANGGIIVKPNCTLQSFLLPLAPLHPFFEITEMAITTMQAISGAGLSGVTALNIIDNVIPFIEGEEEKSETEPLKILGKVTPLGVEEAKGIAISAHCNRVPVLDGHMACVNVKFKKNPSLAEILEVWHRHPHLRYLEEVDRPQPRLDRHFLEGMGVTIGRLRVSPLGGIRFVSLSHNLIRGAAGGGIAIAELLGSEKLSL